MNKIMYLLTLIVLVTSCNTEDQINKPPLAPKQLAVDTYHGQQVEDPYRNLENLKDSTVVDWYTFMNKDSKRILATIPNTSRLETLQKEFLAAKNETVKNIKITKKGEYFYLKTALNQNYPTLVYRNTLKGKEQKLCNPIMNFEGEEAGYYISYFQPDWEGKKVLIGFTKKGEEFSKLKILNVATRDFLPITIDNTLPSYGGVYWSPDNKAILYNRVDRSKTKAETYLDIEFMYHPLDGKAKILFSRNNNPDVTMNSIDLPVVYIQDPDETYYYGAISGATIYQDYYVTTSEEAKNNTQEWRKIFSKEDQVTSFVRDKDSIIYVTSRGASNFQICKTSFLNPDTNNPVVIVPQKENEIIQSLRLIPKGVLYTTIKNGVEASIYLLDSKGNNHKLKLPVKAGKLTVKTVGKNYNYLSIIAEGWLDNKKRYEYDFDNNTFTPADLDHNTSYDFSEKYKVEELEIPSYDGVKVPLSLIYKKEVKLDGKTPVFLIGYGAYGISITPSLSEKTLTWVEEGGIFAIAHVRGGREKGDAWYKGGFKATKQNTWKDLIACAEYMIANQYTSSKKIALHGASAGGITVGRAMTERPDLFGAVIASVGIMNSLRLEAGYNGDNNTKEFGSVKKAEGFKWLYHMDAYHNLEKGIEYPATLIETGMNDARVPPWHSIKFAARLQEYNASATPVLLSLNFDTGHSSSDSRETRLQSVTKVLSFALWQTGHPDYQPE